MRSHCLVGFSIPIVITALALQDSGHLVRTGHDLSAAGLAPNRSELASASIDCDCCWRDCDDKTEHRQVLAKHPLANAGQSDTAGTESLSDVDAWLIVTLYSWGDVNLNMYTPILETVKLAVESYGSVARIVALSDIDSVIQGVKGAAAQGKRPLVLIVAHEWDSDSKTARSKLKEAKQSGAYLVQYQAEPHAHDIGRWGRPRQVDRTMNRAAQMDADEVWEYTMAHVDHYPPHDGTPIVRYVPPGYVSKLDVGVDMSSQMAQASTIGYMGKPKMKEGMGFKYDSILQSRLYETNGIRTIDRLRAYLETYPLQLNQHRIQTCCPREPWEAEYQHFETFRMATVLANKACVISAPSSSKDMALFKGMVTFAEVEDTLPVMERLARNLTDCRIRSYEAYKREFAAPKVLLRSGFFQAWRPPHGK